MNHNIAVLLALLTVAFSGCGPAAQQSTPDNDSNAVQQDDPIATGESSTAGDSSEQGDILYGDKFPEVMAAEATSNGETAWRFNVTLSSLYDSPERYADAWRVLDGNGNELGIRELAHDHAGEQPFTRSGSIQIPSDIHAVFVEGRDQANGWSGQRFLVTLPVATDE